MSEPENFIARWLRVKQESNAAERAPAAGTPTGADTLSDPAAAPFDPASLPPIESITSESDMSAFMQPNVPAELMRAALRTAWIVDPAIRDFVGIAESQWDFNDPSAMPGFGPLLAGDDPQRLAARFSEVEQDVAPPAKSINEPRDGHADLDRHADRDRHADKVWRSSGMPEANPLSVTEAGRTPAQDPIDAQSRVDARNRPQGTRRHGSALPKPVS